MIGACEAFAMAERHAWWCRRTFHATATEIRRELSAWRTRYAVTLADEAIGAIAQHVADSPASVVGT